MGDDGKAPAAPPTFAEMYKKYKAPSAAPRRAASAARVPGGAAGDGRGTGGAVESVAEFLRTKGAENTANEAMRVAKRLLATHEDERRRKEHEAAEITRMYEISALLQLARDRERPGSRAEETGGGASRHDCAETGGGCTLSYTPGESFCAADGKYDYRHTATGSVYVCTVTRRVHVCTSEQCDAQAPFNGKMACKITGCEYGAVHDSYDVTDYRSKSAYNDHGLVAMYSAPAGGGGGAAAAGTAAAADDDASATRSADRRSARRRRRGGSAGGDAGGGGGGDDGQAAPFLFDHLLDYRDCASLERVIHRGESCGNSSIDVHVCAGGVSGTSVVARNFRNELDIAAATTGSTVASASGGRRASRPPSGPAGLFPIIVHNKAELRTLCGGGGRDAGAALCTQEQVDRLGTALTSIVARVHHTAARTDLFGLPCRCGASKLLVACITRGDCPRAAKKLAEFGDSYSAYVRKLVAEHAGAPPRTAGGASAEQHGLAMKRAFQKSDARKTVEHGHVAIFDRFFAAIGATADEIYRGGGGGAGCAADHAQEAPNFSAICCRFKCLLQSRHQLQVVRRFCASTTGGAATAGSDRVYLVSNAFALYEQGLLPLYERYVDTVARAEGGQAVPAHGRLTVAVSDACVEQMLCIRTAAPTDAMWRIARRVVTSYVRDSRHYNEYHAAMRVAQGATGEAGARALGVLAAYIAQCRRRRRRCDAEAAASQRRFSLLEAWCVFAGPLYAESAEQKGPELAASARVLASAELVDRYARVALDSWNMASLSPSALIQGHQAPRSNSVFEKHCTAVLYRMRSGFFHTVRVDKAKLAAAARLDVSSPDFEHCFAIAHTVDLQLLPRDALLDRALVHITSLGTYRPPEFAPVDDGDGDDNDDDDDIPHTSDADADRELHGLESLVRERRLVQAVVSARSAGAVPSDESPRGTGNRRRRKRARVDDTDEPAVAVSAGGGGAAGGPAMSPAVIASLATSYGLSRDLQRRRSFPLAAGATGGVGSSSSSSSSSSERLARLGMPRVHAASFIGSSSSSSSNSSSRGTRRHRALVVKTASAMPARTTGTRRHNRPAQLSRKKAVVTSSGASVRNGGAVRRGDDESGDDDDDDDDDDDSAAGTGGAAGSHRNVSGPPKFAVTRSAAENVRGSKPGGALPSAATAAVAATAAAPSVLKAPRSKYAKKTLRVIAQVLRKNYLSDIELCKDVLYRCVEQIARHSELLRQRMRTMHAERNGAQTDAQLHANLAFVHEQKRARLLAMAKSYVAHLATMECTFGDVQ